MQPAKRLKEKLANKELVLGVMASDHAWVDLPRVLQEAGMDYLIVDCEHGGHSLDLIGDLCTVGRALDFPIIVRPVSESLELVRKFIDVGVCGLMIPIVESTDQLDTVRDAIWLPPRGKRRPGGRGNFWVSQVNYENWVEEVENDFIVMAQIESPKGVENVEAIADHEIVTSLAIGPYDLSANLGCCWEPENPKLVAALKKIRETGEARNMPTWMIGDGPSLQQQGFHFICIGENVAMMKIACANTAAQMRGTRSNIQAAAEHA